MTSNFAAHDWLDRATGDEATDACGKLLREHVLHAAENSPYYKRVFTDAGIDPGTVTLESLSELPITEKQDLLRYNADFLAVPKDKVRDIVFSSGTTGVSTSIMYTSFDLERLSYNEMTAMGRIGIDESDVVLLTCTLDRCFIAGMAYYSGIKAVGASAVRNGANTLQSHMEVIRRTGPSVIVGVPSFLLKLGKFLDSSGMDTAMSGVQKLLCIGEPLRGREMGMRKLGAELQEIWGAKAFSTYASSETVTTFCECESQSGGHLHPALGIVEILDDAGTTLPPGSTGEVVMTPLQVEGMPLIRYRTGDMSFLLEGQCGCGRVIPRLGPILGRKNQMLKLQGTTIYPQAIFSVLDSIRGISEYFVEVNTDYALSDKVRVCVCVSDDSVSERDVAVRLQASLRVMPDVVIDSEDYVRSHVFPAGTRKAIRFIDRRQQ